MKRKQRLKYKKDGKRYVRKMRKIGIKEYVDYKKDDYICIGVMLKVQRTLKNIFKKNPYRYLDIDYYWTQPTEHMTIVIPYNEE